MSRSYTPPGHRPPNSGPSGSPLTLAGFAVAVTAIVVVPTPFVVLAAAVTAVAAVVGIAVAVALARRVRIPRRAAFRLPRSNLRLEVALSRRE